MEKDDNLYDYNKNEMSRVLSACSVNNFFDFSSIKKVCINLPRSTGRRKIMESEFRRLNLNVMFFDAVDKNKIVVPELCDKPKGVFACMSSHIMAIEYARRLGLPAICVFEDDVAFCDDFHERIRYLETLENFDFDILCLGGHFDSPGEQGHPTEWRHIQKISKMGGTYAYIFKASVYDFVLRNASYIFGADEFYSNHVYHRFNSYAFVPFLCGCRPCKSDITGDYWEYENIGWSYQQAPIFKPLKKKA